MLEFTRHASTEARGLAGEHRDRPTLEHDGNGLYGRSTAGQGEIDLVVDALAAGQGGNDERTVLGRDEASDQVVSVQGLCGGRPDLAENDEALLGSFGNTEEQEVGETQVGEQAPGRHQPAKVRALVGTEAGVLTSEITEAGHAVESTVTRVSDLLPIKRLPLLLVHGGLYDDMTAVVFWTISGVTPALDRHIVSYEARDRPDAPADWIDEADALVEIIESKGWEQVAIVAASNGCSAALRLAVDRPDLVGRLVLAWPATAGDVVSDTLARAQIDELGPDGAADALLAGETVRGLTDAEIASIGVDTVIWPSVPENQFHQATTVTSLVGLLRRPLLMGGSPDPTHTSFEGFREALVSMLIEVSILDADDQRQA